MPQRILAVIQLAVALAMLAVFAFMAYCFFASSSDDEPEATLDSSAEDARFSRGACEEFRSTIRDVGDGLLANDFELRERLKVVVEEAIIATPQVEEAARSMLRAATNDSDIAEPTARMSLACEEAGW